MGKSLPNLYIPIQGERYTHTVTLRLPEILMDRISSCLSVLRPYGFSSESDVIRSALAEFIEKYRDIVSDTETVDMLTTAIKISKRDYDRAQLEKHIVQGSLNIIREYLGAGMLDAARKEYSKAIIAISAIEDKSTQELITIKFNNLLPMPLAIEGSTNAE